MNKPLEINSYDVRKRPCKPCESFESQILSCFNCIFSHSKAANSEM